MIINTNELPNETKRIFDYLRDGNFIVDNHPSSEQQRLYLICKKNFNTLFGYFEPLGYNLFEGEGYYIFIIDTIEQNQQHKINQISELIVTVELLLSSFNGFDVGWRGSPSDLEMSAKGNVFVQESIMKMRGITGDTLHMKCTSIFKRLVNFGCFVKMDDRMDTYVLTSSYNYVKDFLEQIEITNKEHTNEQTK